MPDLAFEAVSTKGVAVLRTSGEVDISTAPALREQLESAGQEGGRVVLNLAGVTFMDSTGLGVLTGVVKDLRARGGGLALAAPQRSVRQVLAITQLDSVVPIRDTEEQAVELLTSQPAS